MITVLNKYIYQFTKKGSIKQIAIVVIETRQIALVFPSIAGRNLHEAVIHICRVLRNKLCQCNSTLKLKRIRIGVQAVGPFHSANECDRGGSDKINSENRMNSKQFHFNIVQQKSQTFAPCKTNRQKVKNT